ncbi:MAG: ester cyclase [Chloroflexi bacterium]|nr:ester cyclase [Chloroflexota bacterium]MBI5828834.1 ester cyclase [Chloroflexota bacterium]
MSTLQEQNKAVIRRLIQGVWNEGNAAVLDEVFAADFVDRTALPGATPGREGLKQLFTMFSAAFSDASSTIDDLIAEGDKVAWRWTFRGTHIGPFMGIPATGKTITLTGITIDRIAGNAIVERWNQADFAGMMQQLGAAPQTA